MLSMANGTITYRETPLRWPLRAFIAFIGFCTGLGIPTTWLAEASFSMPVTSLAVLGLVVVICAGFGAIMVMIAFSSVSTLRIDPADDCVTLNRRGPFKNDTTRIPRCDIGLPKVTMRHSDDGPFPILHMPLPAGKPLEMVGFDNRAQADFWRDQIETTLLAPSSKPLR